MDVDVDVVVAGLGCGGALMWCFVVLTRVPIMSKDLQNICTLNMMTERICVMPCGLYDLIEPF